MNPYEIKEVGAYLAGNTYPGRGIIIGKSADGKSAVAAYFIMGRSSNSRNRILAEKEGSLFTEPFDTSRVEDPSLIIYRAIRQYENKLIITNGDQTDTIYDGLVSGISFDAALETREFEPDGPNWTPRISGMLTFEKGDFTYKMSILKSGDAEGSFCNRFGFHYASKAGLGHFLHTYVCDGNPIPTFRGEPGRISIPDDIDAFTGEIWNALDENNRISLYVRYIDLGTGKHTSRLINKNV
ncbi:MAG: IMP cyclohydrolase [Oscillospiraceae bacterium]|nr:IMP cyclohydrolase [Oscillospiraceae bacterium]